MNKINNLSLTKTIKYFTITLIVNLLLISIPFILFIILLDQSITRNVFIVTYIIILLISLPYCLYLIVMLFDLFKKNIQTLTLTNPNLSTPKFLIGLTNKKFTNELFSKNYTYIINFASKDLKKLKLSLYLKKFDFNHSALVNNIAIIRVSNYEQAIYLNPNKSITFQIEYYKFSKIIKSIQIL